jgi:hypothetical protein
MSESKVNGPSRRERERPNPCEPVLLGTDTMSPRLVTAHEKAWIPACAGMTSRATSARRPLIIVMRGFRTPE